MHLDQPLSDKEFNELDKFLLSDRCADDCMTMDSLHGFLTALVVGPQEVLIGEWLPLVWGNSDEGLPAFKSEKECERIVSLIVRYMNEIAVTLEVAPKKLNRYFANTSGKAAKSPTAKPGPGVSGKAWACAKSYGNRSGHPTLRR